MYTDAHDLVGISVELLVCYIWTILVGILGHYTYVLSSSVVVVISFVTFPILVLALFMYVSIISIFSSLYFLFIELNIIFTIQS